MSAPMAYNAPTPLRPVRDPGGLHRHLVRTFPVMENILLVIHTLVAIALVGVVLLVSALKPVQNSFELVQ